MCGPGIVNCVGIPVRMRRTVKDKVPRRGFVPPRPKCFPVSLLPSPAEPGNLPEMRLGAAGATEQGLVKGRTHQGPDPAPPPRRVRTGPGPAEGPQKAPLSVAQSRRSLSPRSPIRACSCVPPPQRSQSPPSTSGGAPARAAHREGPKGWGALSTACAAPHTARPIAAEPRRAQPRVRVRRSRCAAPPRPRAVSRAPRRLSPRGGSGSARGGAGRGGRGGADEAARGAAGCGAGGAARAERPRRHHGSERGRGAARAPPPARLLPRRVRLLLLLRHPAGEHHPGPLRGGREAGEVQVRADPGVHPVRDQRRLRQAPDPFRGRGTAGPHAGLAVRGLLAVLPGRHGVQQLRSAVRQLPHTGAGQVLQTHPSDAAGGDPAAEEVPPSQVPVRAAHRGGGGPVPLQAQKRDRGHRARLWLRGAAPAAVADPGWAHGGVPGPHEGSLPDRLQPHDAQRQPLVHAVPGGRDPVHGGALGVPEFHGALSQHHLQHPPLWPHQRPGPEFHLHDRGVLRAPDLLHHHHHPQVLHHPGLRGALCQPHQPHAVGGHRPGVPGPWARCQIREGGEEDVALRWIGRSRRWNELLIYCLVPQNLVWNWTQDRKSEGNRVGFIFGLSLVWFFNSKWSLKCNPLV